MPSKDPEHRRRRKEHDQDNDSPRTSKDRERHRSSRSTHKPSSRDNDRDSSRTGPPSSDGSSSRGPPRRKVTMIIPEMQRRNSPSPAAGIKGSTPYPSFSKAHSRESVHSRENVSKADPYTPDPTDLGQSRSDKGSSTADHRRTASGPAPPSPPLTHVEPDLRKAKSGSSIRKSTASSRDSTAPGRKSVDTGKPSKYASRREFTASDSSLREMEEGKLARSSTPSKTSPSKTSSSTRHSSKPSTHTARVSASNPTLRSRKPSSSVTDSDATSVAPNRRQQKKAPRLASHHSSSPPSDTASSPRTPHAHDNPSFTAFQDPKPHATGIEVFTSQDSDSEFDGPEDATASAGPPPPPPPPPPPAVNPADLPRVDYLLQNGGLANPVPKSFVSAANPQPPQQYQQYMSPTTLSHVNKASNAQTTFAPFHGLLDNFSTVLSKHGSIAVATGYRSVARRLLDRLEAVFARNISSEVCPCVMCKSGPSHPALNANEEDNGVSWGEVLELVSGRRELPVWPPFSLETSGSGLGVSHLEQEAPMQKLDIDVPEEYRDHYIRQSKKTKQSVQKWLASQPEEQASPPQEVDDETLTFAMLTYLEPDQRRIFTALFRGLNSVPESRTPTPAPTEPKSDLMSRIGLALQRLYRLPKMPREPECAMFLLKNPELHSALVTLSAISQAEWEILISGRFDGFLWGGADSSQPTPGLFRAPSRGLMPEPPSRSATPGGVPLSRGPTPFQGMASGYGPSRNPASGIASVGGPVGFDEETEIAVLAEVEREIYLGMEALEDAFEALHVKAEGVRRSLRERGAALAVTAQFRRGSELEARMGTPAIGGHGWDALNGSGEGLNAESETDDGMADNRSELAPDDSASQIGFKEHGRRRDRKKRREKETVRRKPSALVEEDEEESDVGRPRR